ncbi:hypothetical protein VPH35_010247 [Triticum aestivum]
MDNFLSISSRWIFFFFHCAAPATSGVTTTVSFLDHFPSSHHGHDQAVTKKMKNLGLGGEGELVKPMGPESICKTRLCVSFVAGRSCAFGGRCPLAHEKVELCNPAASREVEDQVILMVFMMVVHLLFCRNA